MTVETLEQMAKSIGISPDRLLLQLKNAGIPVSKASDTISAEQKRAYLDFLEQKHGEPASSEPKKITLKRKSVSEIKVQRSSGQKGTVSVVRKKRHVYVKREPSVDTPDEPILTEIQPELEKTVAESGHPDLNLTESMVAETKEKSEKSTKKTTKEKAAEVSTTTEQTIAAPGVAANANISDEFIAVTPSHPQTVDHTATTSGIAAKPLEEKTETAKHKSRGREAGLDDETGGRAGRNKPKLRAETQDWRKIKDLPKVGTTINLTTEESEEEERPVFSGRRHRSRPKFRESQETVKLKKDMQKKHIFEKPTGPLIREVNIGETITVAELAQQMSAKSGDVIKALMKMGVMATINQSLDQATAMLIAEELGHTVKLVKDNTVEDTLTLQLEQGTGELHTRPPVVTVMGHVDHGKTSLLDYIRRTRVAAKEAGGITQHIGAYHVETSRGVLTFLDTPGHAAFTAMRARGVKCTDIVVLVVAADDGVMPQTIEAIRHAQAANVPIVVAINKIDKASADLNRIHNDLAQHGILPESWGGDVMFYPVSAKEGTGVDALLEGLALQAEVLELKAPNTGPAKGVVLEARLDKGRGPVASVLIQSGTLRQGDMLLAGMEFGRVRAMINEVGQSVTSVGPSMPVEVLGLSGAPGAGDEFTVVSDERKAREIALHRQSKKRHDRMQRHEVSKLEGIFDRIKQGELKNLKIVLKTDVQGSLGALSEALESLSTEQVKVKIIAAGVGGINESDVSLAIASGAILIGFNVRADATARRLAETESLEINYYSIIYEVVDGVKRAINGLLGPEFKERILGLAEVRDVFRSAKLGAIAGCMVTEGIVKRGFPIRVLRDNVVVYQGELESLRRFKEDASEVRSGTECGIGVKNYNDVRAGDQIEVYETIQVNRE